uniref:Uncharacterized protein n=1 Tax=Ciona intestinalis TaxID=7719 RepID=H2XNT3_CIOIN
MACLLWGTAQKTELHSGLLKTAGDLTGAKRVTTAYTEATDLVV